MQPFTWGVATSAYQIEGAVTADGRGPSIWDDFCLRPKKTRGVCGDFAGDHFHRWREDLAAMQDLEVGAYRFSIAWPRLFPDGRTFNPAGLAFYDQLIDALLEAGIEPWVTLYHWDLPCALEQEGGWLSRQSIAAFVQYADCCYRHFGDRVHNWISLNEPWCSSVLGYGTGTHAPGQVSATQPWLAGHHLLLAHAETVAAFRTRFGQGDKHQIGLVNNCDFRRPATPSPADQSAAQEALELMFAWFGDPVYFGDYPDSVKAAGGDHLPSFTAEESRLLKGSSDFLGLNHYATYDAARVDQATVAEAGNAGIFGSSSIRLTPPANVAFTAMNWSIVPEGLGEMLHWLKDRYENPPIYITENGIALKEENIAGAEADAERSLFFETYIDAALTAKAEGVNLQGYFAWCLLDTFEWAWGFDVQFGLIRADMETGERHRKGSFLTYRDIIRSHRD